MKRILAVMVIMALAFSLSACGPVKISKDGIQIKGPDGSTVSLGEKVSLPDGYPKEVAPIIAGGNISFANKTIDDNKQPNYGVMYTVDKPFAEVLSYYKNAFKDATNKSDLESSDFHVLGGTKGAYDFGVTISPTDIDNKKGATVTISILPKGTMSSSDRGPTATNPGPVGITSGGDSSSGSSSGTSTSISGQGGSIPVGYPTSIVPVIAGATIDMGIKTTEQNLSKFSLLLLSDKPSSEVTKYYKDATKGSNSYQEVSFDDVTTFSGEKDVYRFTVGVGPTDPADPKKGSHVQIHLEQMPSASTGTGSSGTVSVSTPSDGDTVTLHVGYPSSTVPLITPHTLRMAVKELEDGADNHYVELETTKAMTDVLSYYDNLLKSAEGYEKYGEADPGYGLAGTKGNYEFYIEIIPVDSSDAKLGTIVYISLYKK